MITLTTGLLYKGWYKKVGHVADIVLNYGIACQ